MVEALACLAGDAPLEAATAAQRRIRTRGSAADMTRPSTRIGAVAPTHDVAAPLVRVAGASAIALNAALPLIELWRIAVIASGPVLRYAFVATIVTIALHLRHVALGVRNERPASSRWTLAALAIANVAAALLIGRIWALQFAMLGVSILIVRRGPSAFALAGAVALAPEMLARTSLGVWQINEVDNIANHMVNLPAAHVGFYIAWRTMVLYIPVRLVAMIQQLDTARRSLESRAVIQARTRIETDLHDGLELALQRIISGGEVASGAVARDPAQASAELRRLVAGSRRALAEARRIAAGYRTGSLRAEIDAATSLLQAAGSTCRIVVADEVSLQADATASSGAIRAAVVRALEDDERSGDYVMRVGLDKDGALQVIVAPDVRDDAESKS